MKKKNKYNEPHTHIFHAWRYDIVLDKWTRPATLKDYQRLTWFPYEFLRLVYILRVCMYPRCTLFELFRMWVKGDLPSLMRKIHTILLYARPEKGDGIAAANTTVTDMEVLSKIEQQKAIKAFLVLIQAGMSVCDIVNLTAYQAHVLQSGIGIEEMKKSGNFDPKQLTQMDDPLNRTPKSGG